MPSNEITHRLDSLEVHMEDMKAMQGRMVEALEKLARVETRSGFLEEAQSRSLMRLDDLEMRLENLEKAAPMTALANRWVIGAVMFVLGSAGQVAVHLLIRIWG
jgi:predicted nuclease with TOPRIM domain